MSDIKLNTYATADTMISALLQAHPTAYRALLECGMGCVSCPSAMVETLGEACMVHGLDVDDVLDYVNHALAEVEQSKESVSERQTEKISEVDNEPVSDEMTDLMMEFFDARSYTDRVRIFDQMKGASDHILNNIAVSMDITTEDGIDNYERILSELMLRKKYEVANDRVRNGI